MRFPAFAIALLLFASASSFAQARAGCAESLSLTAFDEHWRPLDLRPEQLRLKVGHSDVKIDSLQQVSRSPRIVFVIDGSGSMAVTHQARWKIALQTALDVVTTAPQGTQFGVVTIGGPGERQVGFTSDKASTLQLIKSFEKEEPKGRTELYDAIARAVAMFQPAAPGDAIFLLTDGGDNTSRTGWSQVMSGLEKAQVTVVGLLFDDGKYHRAEQTWGDNNVRELIERTGGELYKVDDDTIRLHGMPDVLKSVRTLLSVWYAILYRPCVVELQAGEKPESVQVSWIRSQSTPKSAHLAYRHKLPACSNTQQVAGGK